MRRLILPFFLLLVTFNGLLASQPEDSKLPFSFEASYIGDNAANLSGGIKTGYNYLGFATFNITFDTESAGWWKGGEFFINAANTHGGTPSENLFGDVQVASNIEAGNHTYLQELWFKQKFSKVELTVGLQDLNVEIANTEFGGLYVNSSFGILPTFSLNLDVPIFPLTTLGVTSKWEINDKITWLNAVYDGSPTDFEKNPYNINWQFNSGDGILGVSELQYKMNVNKLPGTYKLGLFAHNHFMERTFTENFPDSLNTNTWGIYGIIDQNLWEKDGKNVGAFMQIGFTPSINCENDTYLGLGVNAAGFLSKSKDDVLGLAVAHSHFNGNSGSETAIELTWQKPICENLFIQPDIQYIIHPSGHSSGLKNVLAGILRFGFTF